MSKAITKTKKPKKYERRTPQVFQNGFQVWNLPEGLRDDFRSACCAKGITMREATILMLRRFVEETGKQKLPE